MDKWKNYRGDPRNYFGRQLIRKAGPAKINLSSNPGVTLSDDNRLRVALLSPQEFRLVASRGDTI